MTRTTKIQADAASAVAVPAVAGGSWSATAMFAVVGPEVLAEVRRWLRGRLSGECAAECAGADDCVLVVHELLDNVSKHGGGGEVTVLVTHGRELTASLVHHAPPVGGWAFPRFTGEQDAPTLAGSGRGLFLVSALCAGRAVRMAKPDCTITRCAITACVCTA